MRALYLTSIWLHVLAAAAWIGGMGFLVAVLVPVLRGRPFGDVQTELLYRVGLRLRRFGWTMMGLLVATGVANVALLGGTWGDLWSGALWDGAWGRALLAKLVLVGAMLLLSGVHDFWVGPRAVVLIRSEPGSTRSWRYTRRARRMGRWMLALSLAVLALAVMLPRGGL